MQEFLKRARRSIKNEFSILLNIKIHRCYQIVTKQGIIQLRFINTHKIFTNFLYSSVTLSTIFIYLNNK